VDTELQDAVAAAQQEDNLVQDAVAKLSDPSASPQHWTIATCQQFKVRMHPQWPALIPIDSATNRLFGQVGIDFMMDLPSSEGFDSIMVIVDHGLSKGVILTPCSKTSLTASHTAQLYINNVYARFRLPDKMISD